MSELLDHIMGVDSDSNQPCTDFQYYTAALGYKKALDSGFTFDTALHLIFIEGEVGVSGKLTLGYSW
ncbi:MAG TPA: hypothetical protein VIM29_11315 [Bacillota bacterium]